MEELKQRLVEQILTQVDPAEHEIEGVDLGQRQAQMALVNRLVTAFAASIEAESIDLSPAQRQALLGDVLGEVMNYRTRQEIARAVVVRPTVERLVRRGTWDLAVVDYLRACITDGRSILISGEAGTGKSTLLAVLATLAPDARIVTVEKNADLKIDHPHLVRLKGEDPVLFDWALRLSPHLILADEVVPANALNALSAMSAVPVIATIKGTSARSALGRLIDWVLDSAPGLSEDLALWLVADHIDVVVNVKRLYQGAHRVSEVVEVLPDPDSELGMDPVTLVALDDANQLAATGAKSALVTDAFLRRLPEADLPTRAPIPTEVQPAPGSVAVTEPARRGFLASLLGGGPPKEAVSAAARGAAIAAEAELTDYTMVGAPPTVQKMTTYLSGDDLFDLSWAIEEGPDFLGEMGVGFAEIVDDGPPKRVAGFEVWMFDKETLETPSGVFLTEAAYDDETLRARYELRGDVVVAAPAAILTLDTGPLRMQARINDVQLDDDKMSFESVTLEFAAWGGGVQGATQPIQPQAELVEEPIESPSVEVRGFLAGLFGRRQPKEAVSAAARGAAITAEAELTDFTSVGVPPIVQKMTTYLSGDDLFDLSWAIEEGPEFLGEMGVGFAEVAEDGPPKRVTGFEVWMFDKETLETPSGVFLTESAYADDTLRARHEPRGDVIAAEPGAELTLDTGPLRVQVQVKDLEMAGSDLTFERVTFEFAAWKGSA